MCVLGCNLKSWLSWKKKKCRSVSGLACIIMTFCLSFLYSVNNLLQAFKVIYLKKTTRLPMYCSEPSTGVEPHSLAQEVDPGRPLLGCADSHGKSDTWVPPDRSFHLLSCYYSPLLPHPAVDVWNGHHHKIEPPAVLFWVTDYNKVPVQINNALLWKVPQLFVTSRLHITAYYWCNFLKDVMVLSSFR